MRNLKLTIAYDGTEFHGWQVQPELVTVQGTLQGALARLFNHDVAVHGSGRTDAGVHAEGQVASVGTLRTMDTGAVLRGANALLPPSIRVMQVSDVAPGFHARHSALAKTYRYRVWRRHIVPPFLSRYVYRFTYPLDPVAMDEACLALTGTHDFTSFCATTTEVEDRVRTIYSAAWERAPDQWIFQVRGSGFLKYMVRTLVGTLLYVGLGKVKSSAIPAIFAARDRRLAGPSAPAHGLHLASVEYAPAAETGMEA